MYNIKLLISYDGTRYSGWQKQGNTGNTIQSKIEGVISRFLGEKINLIGSGRTDAGVHADKQVANFWADTNVSIEQLLEYCYNFLPEDIVIYSGEYVDDRFHSRNSVKKKVYKYRIWNNKFHNPIERKYSLHVPEILDLKKIKEAANIFIGRKDFRSFTKLNSKKKSTIREIYSIDIDKYDSLIEIVFCGNGFLYKMIRMITGVLIDVGLNSNSYEEVKNILNTKESSLIKNIAPAHGLFLFDVEY